jgi:hypothetical protein
MTCDVPIVSVQEIGNKWSSDIIVDRCLHCTNCQGENGSSVKLVRWELKVNTSIAGKGKNQCVGSSHCLQAVNPGHPYLCRRLVKDAIK